MGKRRIQDWFKREVYRGTHETTKKSISSKDYKLKDFTLKVNNRSDDPSLTILEYKGKDAHVTIPGYIKDLQIKKIGKDAFSNNTDIKKITIKQGVTFIENTAFGDCTELTDVELPDGLLKIGNEAFFGCKKLAKIRFPESLLSIGSHAFIGCEELTSIFIPKKVQYLGGNKFSECSLDCSRLKEIVVDDGNNKFSSLDGVLFNKAKTLLIKYPEGKEDASYRVPDTVISIKDRAFNCCKNLIAVTFPEKFLSLPAGIFSGCKRLKKVTLSQKTKIEPYAFLDSSVKYVTGIDKITLKKMRKKENAKSLKEVIEILNKLGEYVIVDEDDGE
jgi:hypothetical protein